MRRKSYLAFSSLFLLVLLLVSVLFDIGAGIFDFLLSSILEIMDRAGYLGIFLAMVLDSALLPIFPNEIIVPLSGFASSGVPEVIFVSLLISVANLVGSIIAYYIGHSLGRDFILKYGKYLFLSRKNLRKAEEFFEEHGEGAVFFSRLMPAVKTIISFPAGMVGMNKPKFVYMTFFGSLLLNLLLAFSGYFLGAGWPLVNEVFSRFELFFIGLGVLLVVYIFKYS